MEENYLDIKYFGYDQITNRTLAYTKLKYVDLKNRVKFTSRTSDEEDPFSNSSNNENILKQKTRFYQRLEESVRVGLIRDFLLGEIIKNYKYEKKTSGITPLGTFPSAMILAVNTFNSDSNEEITIKQYEENYLKNERTEKRTIELCFHLISQNIIKVPNEEIMLIVDGQHRIAGLNLLKKEVQERTLKTKWRNLEKDYGNDIFEYILMCIDKFEFVCTLMIDFDKYEQGLVFANTNFNQKPVNRSIYYDIFGSSPDTDRNELKFAHDIVAHLNYNNDSVLKDRIKMLGKGEGLISQAAMVESIMILFKPGRALNKIYSDYISKGNQYKYVTVFMRSYFAAFQEVFKDFWPLRNEKKSKHILCKTTGMGAILKLIDKFYPFIIQELSNDISVIGNEKIVKEKISTKLLEIKLNGGHYFSGDDTIGAFCKGAGKGMQGQLYNELALDLGFIKQKKQTQNEELF